MIRRAHLFAKQLPRSWHRLNCHPRKPGWYFAAPNRSRGLTVSFARTPRRQECFHRKLQGDDEGGGEEGEMTARDGDGYTIIHRGRAGCFFLGGGGGFNLVGLPAVRSLSSAVAPLSPLRTLATDLPSASFFGARAEFSVRQHASFRLQSVLILCAPIISREK